MAETATKRVVIVGGGVIGAACAHYLTKEGGHHLTIIEKGAVACHASGKAGGFLSKTCNDASSCGPLTRASFALHLTLADEFGADAIGYRRLKCIGVGLGAETLASTPWLDGTDGAERDMGGPDDFAQVKIGVLGWCFFLCSP
jgi:glycine/D-amino acid oxidase-like deaminating enzyme